MIWKILLDLEKSALPKRWSLQYSILSNPTFSLTSECNRSFTFSFRYLIRRQNSFSSLIWFLCLILTTYSKNLLYTRYWTFTNEMSKFRSLPFYCSMPGQNIKFLSCVWSSMCQICIRFLKICIMFQYQFYCVSKTTFLLEIGKIFVYP